MSFQAYLDNIKAKTGRTPEDFRALAAKKRLTQFGEVIAWLKADFGLGHGHANAIAQLVVKPDKFLAGPDVLLEGLFAGDKAKWRKAYDALASKISKFGADIKLAPNRTYINVQRGARKFALLQQSTAERFDIGIKLKGAAPAGRFEASGSWNAMVTHRVRISDPKQIDAEVLQWLKRAYEAA
jgi:hypothetical protein